MSNELSITKEVTPSLYESVKRVTNKLNIPENLVEPFVYSSAELNAQCYSSSSGDCIIRVTSSLVEKLTLPEFEFVLGHELGHFLLCHNQARLQNQNSSMEFYIQQRAQEISADRIGYIACGSINIALKALIKSVSGLDDKYLKFDIGAFMSQLRKVDISKVNLNYSTHPSVTLRCRALLWFSMVKFQIDEQKPFNQNDMLTELDERIQRDINRYIDFKAQDIIEQAKMQLRMWTLITIIVETGSFSKQDQEKFSRHFGEENLVRMKGFLNGYTNQDLKNIVAQKKSDAASKLRSLIPSNYETESQEIAAWRNTLMSK